jgi:hypothetical protein
MSFLRGFLNGLSVSLNLYAEPHYIEPAKIEIKKLHRSIANPVEAMHSDWAQVGNDLRSAFDAIRFDERS